ncbi:LuxR family transcriptional regulator [Hoeflea marina]|uniref:LuxR family transcriptional regulator n=1 Tax=Hoeflea marina TaxID=274592 RepID=A0A317PGN9_9HYPH|nr:LuxR family transcriptional regulator [Hoeflea marina]PWV98214.1 LuxR family transcriptional regulator [Hoeflea marina]
MSTSTLCRFLDTDHSQLGLDEMIAALEQLVEQFGFTYFTLTRQVCSADDIDTLMLAGCWPQGWPEIYVQRKYAAVDPLVRYLGHCQRGYRWSEALSAFRNHPQRKRMERVMVDARKFGLADGYVFPVHGRRGLIGVLTLGGNKVDLTAGQMALFDTVAKKAFWLVLERRDPVTCGELAAPVDVEMTRREMETLGYLAKGLTSHQVGSTLGLSTHTVDWYMNSIQDKLKARNRHHAVAIAFRLGLIN